MKLKNLILEIEQVTGKKAKLIFGYHQPGNFDNTWAEVSKSFRLLKWKPQISLKEGLIQYYSWFSALPDRIKALYLQ